tara:strand:+ start:22153 stop:22350 length:198 start_codon:yes stop_codon:yes gene_type:complete
MNIKDRALQPYIQRYFEVKDARVKNEKLKVNRQICQNTNESQLTITPPLRHPELVSGSRSFGNKV